MLIGVIVSEKFHKVFFFVAYKFVLHGKLFLAKQIRRIDYNKPKFSRVHVRKMGCTKFWAFLKLLIKLAGYHMGYNWLNLVKEDSKLAAAELWNVHWSCLLALFLNLWFAEELERCGMPVMPMTTETLEPWLLKPDVSEIIMNFWKH